MYIKKIVAAVAVLGLVALGIFSYQVYNIILAPNTSFTQETADIYIPSNSNYPEVIEQLKLLLKDVSSFNMVAEKKGYGGKPGHFILKKGMNNNEIINVLRNRNTPISVVFNNQERLEDLAGRISKQIEADSISLLESMRDAVFLSENNFDLNNALSMYVPNKYQFFWNTSAEGFRSRMLKEYNRFWSPERKAKAKEIGLSPLEVSVLASIVQKETAKIVERPKVAGVYMNRLQKGWKLEADPTVIYAIKRKNNNYDTIVKRVLYKDLELDSPYNTYRTENLPPGPIFMPDISSLEAVLNYEKHQYFYFVADPSKFGFHKFSKTLSQHNANKRTYVKWLNTRNIKR